MKWYLTLCFSFLFTSIPPLSLAEEQMSSNLENFTYPNHNCGKKINKPTPPIKTTLASKVEEYNNKIIEYNIKVASYNKNIKRYKKCINEYIKNGNSDIKVIRDRLNKALQEARKRH